MPQTRDTKPCDAGHDCPSGALTAVADFNDPHTTTLTVEATDVTIELGDCAGWTDYTTELAKRGFEILPGHGWRADPENRDTDIACVTTTND